MKFMWWFWYTISVVMAGIGIYIRNERLGRYLIGLACIIIAFVLFITNGKEFFNE
jgi:drug/metabolite transporter (DMT)-like permease